MERKNKPIAYLGAVCFAVVAIIFARAAILNIHGRIIDPVVFFMLVLSYALLAVMLLSGNKTLGVLGGAIGAVIIVLSPLLGLRFSGGLSNMLQPVFFILIALAAWKKSKITAFISVAVCAAMTVVVVMEIGFDLNLGLVRAVASTLGCLFFALSYDSLVDKPSKAAAGSAQPTSGASTVERLSSLKAMLDSGIISQEEFDEKKKQIMGL